MVIESRAPTRIDLAGGTVDIWPIYLFLRHPVTLNLAIDLFAEARLEEAADTGAVKLVSGDQGQELVFAWSQLEQITPPPALELHHKLLRHFAGPRLRDGALDTKRGLTLTTHAKSPAGAGLGGSSTLCVALIGALHQWAHGRVDPLRDGVKLIELIRDTETTVIKVPAGMQDYYGAMYGGLQSLRWHPGTNEREWLSPEVMNGLQDRLLLFYSGQSRNSGINNWALFKAFIDNQGRVRDQFAGIGEATAALERALRIGDWQGAGEAIGREWEIRRGLTDGISTPEMDAAFETARTEGGTAGKVCGAGGGGCFFIYVPSGNFKEKARVREKIAKLGLRELPFKAVPRGLDVRVTP